MGPNNDRDNPVLRLFLSVDIAGSTRMKDHINHASIMRSYDEILEAIQSIDSGFHAKRNTEEKKAKLLSVVEFGEFHWAKILEKHFQDFHTCFLKNIQDRKELEIHTKELPKALWKCLGDEMIYSFEIQSTNQVHWLVTEFLHTIRQIDKEGVEVEGRSRPRFLRVKGTAWTAGFPIRNRVVKLPNEDNDFLGPDIDIGFRLTNFSYPGILCVSMDLAYILGHASADHSHLTGEILKWKPLKGAWGNVPYPIIWCAFQGAKEEELELDYSTLRPWSSGDSEIAGEWEKINKKNRTDIGDLRDKIEKTYEALPNDLFIFPPYIIGDETLGKMPPEHERIHNLLQLSSNFDNSVPSYRGNNKDLTKVISAAKTQLKKKTPKKRKS